MSQSDTDDYGAEFLTRVETIEGTWKYGGREFKLRVSDISMGEVELLQEYARVAGQAVEMDGEVDDARVEELNEQAEELDPLPWEDESSYDGFLECTIDAKLEKPDVEVHSARAPKLTAVFEGMMEAWQEGNR